MALRPPGSGAPAKPPSTLTDVRLTAITYAAHDINLYTFEHPEGKLLPGAEPGAHIDIHLPQGQVRQYSLIDAAADMSRYIVGVKLSPDSKGGSQYMHLHLRPGTLVKVSAPRNNFPLDETAEHSIFVAGGIGVTPVRSMLMRLRTLGHSWQLHYACRSRQDAAFLAELEHLEHVHLHFDQERPGHFLDLEAIVNAAPAHAHAYCCGPAPMLTAFENATAHWQRERVHVEYFSAKHESAAEGGFTVELHKSGQALYVPRGKTILQVVTEAGVHATNSCMQGVCGACETRIIDGIPDHRDSVLTAAERRENRTLMICCSGSKSERLVLDL